MARMGQLGIVAFLLWTRLWVPALCAEPIADIFEARTALDQGYYPGAIRLAREVLRGVEQENGPGSLAAAEALDVLVEAMMLDAEAASYYVQRAELDDRVESYAERAVTIREAEQGPDHPGLIPSLANLAAVRFWNRHESPCLPLERALRIAESEHGKEHAVTAKVLSDLGSCTLDVPRFEKSLSMLRRALEIQEKCLGTDHPDVATTLFRMGVRYFWTDTTLSRTYFRKALEIRERVFPEDHPMYAASLVSVARGEKPASVLSARERALEIQERSLGPGHPGLAWNLTEIGLLWSNAGDNEKAGKAFERALAIMEDRHGPNDVRLLVHMRRLAAHRIGVGDPDGAGALLQRAAGILESQPSSPDGTYAYTYAFFARLAFQLGDEVAAKRLRERAVLLADAFAAHPNVAWAKGTVLGAVGDMAREASETGRARVAYEKALSYWEAVPGVDPLTAATTSIGLGVLELEEGNYRTGLVHLKKALDMVKDRTGPRSPLLHRILQNLSEAEWLVGEKGPALSRALRAESIRRENLRMTSRWLPERRALVYAAKGKRSRDIAMSFAALDRTGAALHGPEIWDAVIRTRALVLDEMASRHRAITSDHVPASAVAEFVSARRRYANVLVRGPAGENPESYERSLAELLEETERIERELASRSREFRRGLQRARIGYDAVSSTLREGDALVAFVRYERLVSRSVAADEEANAPSRVPERVPSYLAWTLSSPGGQPVAIPLGDADAIDGLVREWKREVSTAPPLLTTAARRSERSYRSAGEALRRRIWDPVARHLGKVRRILIVPDGALHLVSFSALPGPSGRYLVETGLRVHYLSSEREIVRSTGPSDAGQSLLALGGPDFDASPGALPAMNERFASILPATASEREVYRGATIPCDDFHSLRFRPLPASLDEVGEISGVWSRGEGVVALTGPLAREDAFKRIAGQFGVLHLATHAFFVSGECMSENVANRLRLSGMVLAGANRRGEAGLLDDDGILTAEEIASLDLSAVDWAVLSACDTGTGDVMNGEGVLGLRRAFEIAGARTLIMSLWPVQDEATRAWMTELYRGRAEGLSTAEAVRRASLRRLAAARKAGRTTHPFYWGAFVAAGDWR